MTKVKNQVWQYSCIGEIDEKTEKAIHLRMRAQGCEHFTKKTGMILGQLTTTIEGRMPPDTLKEK